MFNRIDASKSTKGASKLRRDLINAEIANLRDLLPLPPSTRQRLSQLQLMALVCVFLRKANYFQHVLKNDQESASMPTPNIGFSKAMSGFIMMMTQQGKLLYISENAAEYLGHSMEDLLIHGDSVYDVVDKQDHMVIQSQLARVGGTVGNPTVPLPLPPPASPSLSLSTSTITSTNTSTTGSTGINDDRRLFLCRINVSRNSRRQLRFGDQKVVLVEGHYLPFVPLCNRNESVFLASCTPVVLPETRESVVQGATNIFTTIHSMDMKYLHIDKTAESHMEYNRSELVGVSWYNLIHWDSIRTAYNKHQTVIQSEQERSSTALIRLQSRSGRWFWVHCVLQVKDTSEECQHPIIVCTNQVLSEKEAEIMRASSWLYQYSSQNKYAYGVSSGGISTCTSIQQQQQQMETSGPVPPATPHLLPPPPLPPPPPPPQQQQQQQQQHHQILVYGSSESNLEEYNGRMATYGPVHAEFELGIPTYHGATASSEPQPLRLTGDPNSNHNIEDDEEEEEDDDDNDDNHIASCYKDRLHVKQEPSSEVYADSERRNNGSRSSHLHHQQQHQQQLESTAAPATVVSTSTDATAEPVDMSINNNAVSQQQQQHNEQHHHHQHQQLHSVCTEFCQCVKTPCNVHHQQHNLANPINQSNNKQNSDRQAPLGYLRSNSKPLPSFQHQQIDLQPHSPLTMVPSPDNSSGLKYNIVDLDKLDHESPSRDPYGQKQQRQLLLLHQTKVVHQPVVQLESVNHPCVEHHHHHLNLHHLEQWSAPSPVTPGSMWQDCGLQRVPDVVHQELSPYITTPTTPADDSSEHLSTAATPETPVSIFNFDWPGEQHVPNLRVLSFRSTTSPAYLDSSSSSSSSTRRPNEVQTIALQLPRKKNIHAESHRDYAK